MVTTRPTIAVSRCLLGEAVRYDGRSKPTPELIEAIASSCTIIPVCPEVEAGLSTPRPPVEWVQLEDGTTILRGRDDHSLEVTDALSHQTSRFIQQHSALDAALLQNRSPSCGVGDTPRFTTNGFEIERGDGYFTAALRRAYPNILITTPQALLTSTSVEQLLKQIKSNRKTYPY